MRLGYRKKAFQELSAFRVVITRGEEKNGHCGRPAEHSICQPERTEEIQHHGGDETYRAKHQIVPQKLQLKWHISPRHDHHRRSLEKHRETISPNAASQAPFRP